VDSNKTELVISNTDYNTLQLNIQKYDSLKTIELEPNDSSLDESIVMGYNKNAGDSKETNAHPNLGWDNLKTYLKENAISAGGKTGTVKLSFYVHNDGTITAIKVIKGCDKITDQKAIDLINDGPGWIGNINGQTEKINLTVDFNK
jgi:TonB family protein